MPELLAVLDLGLEKFGAEASRGERRWTVRRQFYAQRPHSSRQGLCGAAAKSGQVVVVDDVPTDSRYLSGSALVKSEIVVPIFVKKTLAAELDIESYFSGTFTKVERDFVEPAPL
jgi:hypothetical protein